MRLGKLFCFVVDLNAQFARRCEDEPDWAVAAIERRLVHHVNNHRKQVR